MKTLEINATINGKEARFAKYDGLSLIFDISQPFDSGDEFDIRLSDEAMDKKMEKYRIGPVEDQEIDGKHLRVYVDIENISAEMQTTEDQLNLNAVNIWT